MSGTDQRTSNGRVVDTKYVDMLEFFKKCELQTLLASFGHCKAASKHELKQLAIYLVFNEVIGFCHQLYLVKIIELYILIQSGRISTYSHSKSITANFYTKSEAKKTSTIQAISRTNITRRIAPY